MRLCPFKKLSILFFSNDLSNQDVARIIGCTPATLSSYMTAKQPFPTAVALAIMQHFNVPIEEYVDLFILPFLCVNSAFYDINKDESTLKGGENIA